MQHLEEVMGRWDEICMLNNSEVLVVETVLKSESWSRHWERVETVRLMVEKLIWLPDGEIAIEEIVLVLLAHLSVSFAKVVQTVSKGRLR